MYIWYTPRKAPPKGFPNIPRLPSNMSLPSRWACSSMAWLVGLFNQDRVNNCYHFSHKPWVSGKLPYVNQGKVILGGTSTLVRGRVFGLKKKTHTQKHNKGNGSQHMEEKQPRAKQLCFQHSLHKNHHSGRSWKWRSWNMQIEDRVNLVNALILIGRKWLYNFKSGHIGPKSSTIWAAKHASAKKYFADMETTE